MSRTQDDLIVARATAAGPSALAIVRLDGAGVAEVVRRLFRPRGKADPTRRPREMVFGRWHDPVTGEPIDEGLTVFFAAPHSHTGNEAAEFHCHGGALIARRLIEAVLAAGGRLAEPGEFTRRAFLNGKMDLTQAEAVADLIGAQTEAAARLARGQYAGALGREIAALRESLIALAAEIEARIDFPEEDLEAEDRARLEQAITAARERVARLLATRRRGRLLREGARVVLVGRPNSGKSSLLNALVRAERAIVTPHPGTTRDTIECTIDLAGIPLTLVDTAGLRASEDPVEQLGIERSRREIERADLVILVHDVSGGEQASIDFAQEEPALAERPPDLVALNKIDLREGTPDEALEEIGLPLSATRGDGLDRLERAIATRLMGEGSGGDELGLAVNLRHGELLQRAAQSLDAVREGFDADRSGELLMVDLREAIDTLGEILGLETGDAILDSLFSRFCIGK